MRRRQGLGAKQVGLVERGEGQVPFRVGALDDLDFFPDRRIAGPTDAVEPPDRTHDGQPREEARQRQQGAEADAAVAGHDDPDGAHPDTEACEDRKEAADMGIPLEPVDPVEDANQFDHFHQRVLSNATMASICSSVSRAGYSKTMPEPGPIPGPTGLASVNAPKPGIWPLPPEPPRP